MPRPLFRLGDVRRQRSDIGRQNQTSNICSLPFSKIRRINHYMNKPKQHHSISCASDAAFLYLIGDYIALVLVEFSHCALVNKNWTRN